MESLRFSWILLLFATSSVFGQESMVLDGPFIHEKEIIFEPMTGLLNYHLNEMLESKAHLKNSNQEFEKRSFLYSEHEYNRVRVYQEVDLDQKDQLRNRLLMTMIKYDDFYVSATDLKLQTRSVTYHHNSFSRDYSEVMQDSVFKQWDDSTFTTKDLYRSNISDFAKNDLPVGLDLKNNLDENYKPSMIHLADFNTMFWLGLNEGKYTLYKDDDFTIPFNEEKLMEGLTITSLRLKTDYFINLISGEIDSKVLGLGVYSGQDEIGWVYYPEFRWHTMHFYNYYNSEILSFDYVLESNYLNSKIIGIYGDENPNSKYRTYFDSDWCVWLDPYVFNHLQKFGNIEGVPLIDEWSFGSDTMDFGYAQAFYSDSTKRYSGNSLIHENMNAVFEFYHPNGKIKAIHNYENGDLHGEQQLFYSNGQEYARYRMEHGEIIDLVRYFENGVMMEKGSFTKGIPDGRWSHTIQCSNEVFTETKFYLEAYDNIGAPKIFVQKEGYYTYFIDYQFEYCENCPWLFHKLGKDQGVLRKRVILE